ncbi:hypothetical protein SAMN05216387_105120 [Nitrosovibrio tenuis]|uniref:Uncharacterized protein n=1 Tax=Nitrosovibrio tenuis TaxID=1233 RepID=A0A1H7MLE9_9PROT|nr:hypothetical protein SAMN05216387_105120 [Nitrosovibrio tenuis]
MGNGTSDGLLIKMSYLQLLNKSKKQTSCRVILHDDLAVPKIFLDALAAPDGTFSPLLPARCPLSNDQLTTSRSHGSSASHKTNPID